MWCYCLYRPYVYTDIRAKRYVYHRNVCYIQPLLCFSLMTLMSSYHLLLFFIIRYPATQALHSVTLSNTHTRLSVHNFMVRCWPILSVSLRFDPLTFGLLYTSSIASKVNPMDTGERVHYSIASWYLACFTIMTTCIKTPCARRETQSQSCNAELYSASLLTVLITAFLLS